MAAGRWALIRVIESLVVSIRRFREAALVPYSCLSADHSDAERAAARYSDKYPAHAPLGQTDIIVA